ncbi:unnamed protein product [Tilletia controversa]|uniref:J domain-containing protein n=3 Tax=Tilletia TaxID=13289 RepID=A0A8X7STM0_9BASI|nr:hypothetical protein CF336_g7459 [Tilletia laevis]KAE8188279.1 hypothetical protein CF328_g6653 [Tilletia controversa]KAE8252251.1 hypothetical protein A4X03_0g6218 [Tilletia caries]KAE8188647.1 hypothetical protein CF335_g6842 [Tilletia laevis]KAE8239771.1 hypothetical protein A4X06_0g8056 [Tilletia controversa]
MSTSTLLLPTRPKEPYTPLACPYTTCRASIEYLPPTRDTLSALPANETTFKVTCCACKQRFEPPGATRIVREARAAGGNGSGGGGQANGGNGGEAQRRKRRIGTDENPLDMTFYDTLGLPASATQDEIKKAYRKLAIKLHPDKNPNNPEVEEMFKMLATAYQVLSDPALRHKYNEFGASTPGLAPEDGFVDPEEVFGSLFGGERFLDIIGVISIGKDMKDALQKDSEELEREANAGNNVTASGGNGSGAEVSSSGSGSAASQASPNLGKDSKPTLTPEQKAANEEREKKANEARAKAREERVKALSEKLIRKLSVYTESIRGAGVDADLAKEVEKSFKEINRIEAEELKGESYGVELLHAVGSQYVAKSKHYLAATGPLWGIGGMFHSAASGVHVLRETVSTVRAALEVKSVFEELQKAENSESGLTEERRRQLEEAAAEKGMRALFKGAKLEVESVIREVTEKVLYDANVSKETQRLRALALGIVGEVYSNVKTGPAQTAVEGHPEGFTNAQGDGANKEKNEADYVRVDTKASKARDQEKEKEGGEGGQPPRREVPPIPEGSQPYTTYQSKRASQQPGVQGA